MKHDLVNLSGHTTVVPFETRLLNSTPVLIRALEPGDRPHVVAGIRALSSATLLHRFQTPVFRPTAAQIDYLTHVDQVNHLALCAVDTSGPEDVGAGIARCVRLADRPTFAELAITVADPYQRQGLGLILLAALSRFAALQGIETFVGYVDAERRGLLHHLRTLQGHVASYEGGTAEIHIGVLQSPSLFPDTETGRLGMRTLVQAG